MPNSSIGLIIWGCKGGHRVFCSNNVVDYKEKSIADTLKDLRSYIRFNQINLTTYALEFTNQYKVFTIYRSCNDNGTGAYVAITMYVPHALRVQEIRRWLEQMMDVYFKEYIHPVFGTYHGGKYDDIEPYSQLLQSVEVVPESEYYSYHPSIQNDLPHLFLYDDIKTIDALFDLPYRKEFFCCQEVMFMARTLYEKKEEAVSFNAAENLITKVSEPDLLPQLFVGNNGDVYSIKINGIEVAKSEKHPIRDHDKICIILHRNYYEDIKLEGTTKELKQKGKLIEQAKKISIFPQPFRPKEYDLTFRVNGDTCQEDLLYIRKQEDTECLKVAKGVCTMKGDELSKIFDILLLPCPLVKDSGSLLKLKTFIPKKLIDDGNQIIDIDVASYEFKVSCGKGVRFQRFYVCLPAYEEHIVLPAPEKSGEKYKLNLPKEVDITQLQFQIHEKGIACEFDVSRRILMVSSDIVQFSLQVPPEVRHYIQDDWDYQIKGISKKIPTGQLGGSYKLQLSNKEHIDDGILTIKGKACGFTTIEGGDISPKLIYVPKASFPVGNSVTFVREEIFSQSEYDVASIIEELKEKYPKCDIRESNHHSCIILSIQPKQDRQEDKNSEQNYTSVIKNELTPVGCNFKLRLVHCRGFELKGIPVDPIIKKDNTATEFSANEVTIHSKGKLRCVVYKDSKRYHKEQKKKNEKNGFSISYTENECIVTYNKSQFSLLNSLNTLNLLKNKYFRKIIGIIVVVMAAWGGWNIWNLYLAPEKIFKVASISFSFDAAYGDKLDNVILHDSHIQLNAICKSRNYFIVDILWDKDAKADTILNSNIEVKYSNLKRNNTIKLKEYNDVAKYIKGVLHDTNKKDFGTKSFKSPSQKTIEELEELTESKSDSLATSVFDCGLTALSKVKGNSKAEEKILGMMKNEIENTKEEGEKEEAIKQFLDKFKDYSKNSVFSSVKNESDEKAAIKQQLEQVAKKKAHALKDLSCTEDTVKNVSKWYNDLGKNEKDIVNKIYNFGMGVGLFNTFFNAEEKTKMDVLGKKTKRGEYIYESYFGEEQFEVITKGFLHSTDRFKEFRCVKNFKKAYDIYNKAYKQNQQ